MSFARDGQATVVECVIAGGLVGACEASLAASVATACGVASWIVVAALAALGATVGAAVLNAALAALRIGPFARWAGDLGAGGTRRVLAVGRAVLCAAAIGMFAAATLAIAGRGYTVFRALHGATSPTFGSVMACLLTPIAAAIAAAAFAVHRRYAPRIANLPGGLDGKRGWIAGALLLAALTALPIAVVHHEVPAMKLGPVISGALTVGIALALRLLDISRYRAARLAALGLGAAILVSAAMIGRAEQARLIAVELGSYSRLVAKGIWRLADRDGDGYAAAWAGGADCDDADPYRNPAQPDVIGNGIDENCTGADAVAPDPDPPAARVTARVSPADAPGAAPDPDPHAGTTVRIATPDVPGAPPNLILISIDALRADHLGAWGYARPTSPVLDHFAAGATRFAWAVTSSPETIHALPSMLTGRHASANRGSTPAPSLAEILRDAGYDTRAVMCCQRITPPRGLRGFTSVDTSAEDVRLDRAGQANADVVADATIDWLRHTRSRPSPQPFLLWVHFYDPHEPYQAPPGNREFGSRDIDRYDAEVAFVDREIGRVLDAIDQLGFASNSVVAITSDHGEEFDEHGIPFHGRSLYNQVVHIPLLIRAPGCPSHVIEAPVSLVDLAPTLLDLAGIPAPRTIHGHSLSATVCGNAVPARPVLVELIRGGFRRDAVAMMTPRWKVIWDREANAWMLFAHSDPEDRYDRSTSDPATLAAMKQQLLALIDRELAVPAPAARATAATADANANATAAPRPATP